MTANDGHPAFDHGDGTVCILDERGVWFTPYDAGGEGPDCERTHLRAAADKWLWLRGVLEDDAAALAELADATADPNKARHLNGKAAYAVTALRHMDDADRVTGPNA